MVADPRRLLTPMSMTLNIDGSLRPDSPPRMVAALDCPTGFEASTTPEQIHGLESLRQTLFVFASTEAAADDDSTGMHDEAAASDTPGSPRKGGTEGGPLVLAAASCASVSWAVRTAVNEDPVIEAAMEGLVLAAIPHARRALFRLNSIAMISSQHKLIRSDCADDGAAPGQDLVYVSYRPGAGPSVSNPHLVFIILTQSSYPHKPHLIPTYSCRRDRRSWT